MKPRKQMCPNASCEHFQQATGILGGCECGTALVPFYMPPTDDQLEKFIAVLMRAEVHRRGFQVSDTVVAHAVRIAMRHPADKAMWLDRHRQLQDTANAA